MSITASSNAERINGQVNVYLLGVRIHPVSLRELLGLISRAIKENQQIIIANVNVHAMNIAYEIAWFREFLNQADLVFCDGFGVRLAARLSGQNLPYRFTPPDWIPQLCALCVENSFSLYLLGAQPGVAEQAAEKLTGQFPGLRIAGTDHGYHDKTQGSANNQDVIRRINAVRPDILIVGFGMHLQEHWLMENWEGIDARVALPVGAAIDYMAGTVKRAPRWMTDHGLEWLGRLVIEPRRLCKRYLIGNPLFFYRVLRERFRLRSSR